MPNYPSTSQVFTLAQTEYKQLSWYLQTVALGLLVYEYAITLSREIDLFWGHKINITSIIFVTNRYLPLLVSIVDLPWSSGNTSRESCGALVYTQAVLGYLQYFPWAFFSALRAYALSSRSWSLALLVFVLSVLYPMINYVTLAFTYTVPNSQGTTFVMSDLLVLGVTWRVTYRAIAATKTLGYQTFLSRLSQILLREGLVYFLIILVSNILHMVLYLASLMGSAEDIVILHLSDPLIAIVLSRFLMNLQEAGRFTPHERSRPSTGDIKVNKFIGSIGLTHHDQDETLTPGAHGETHNSPTAVETATLAHIELGDQEEPPLCRA